MFNITIIMVALAAGEPRSSVTLPVAVNYLPSQDVHRHSTPASEQTRVNEGRQGQPQLAPYLAATLIAQSQERSGRTKVIHETEALIGGARYGGLVRLGSDGLTSHSALQDSMGHAGTGFSASSADVSDADAAAITVFAGGIGAASASMLPSLAEVQSAAISAAGGGIPSKPGQASKLKTPAQTHRTVRSYSPSGKVSANVSDMSPRAKRFADYLATLPPPNNATRVNGDEVNADRLSQPWPEPVDCGRYWNESHPSCSVYSDPWGFDALLPVGRGTTLFSRSGAARPFLRSPASGRIVMGLESHLDQFARQQGGISWKVWAKEDPIQWKAKAYEVLNNPKNTVLFNLDGVDVGSGIMRASRKAGGATDWELLQIYSRKDWWPRIKWMKDGKLVSNPFE